MTKKTTKTPKKKAVQIPKKAISVRVTAQQKKLAETIGRHEGHLNFSELFIDLIAERHKKLLKQKAAKKARAAKKASLRSTLPGLPAKSRRLLTLRNSSASSKPSRTSSTRKRTGSSTARSTTNKALNGGVVAAPSRKVGRTAGRTTKNRTAANS
jgi:hypothetical protein